MKQLQYGTYDCEPFVMAPQFTVRTAKLQAFHGSRSPILFGDTLKSILQIEASISKNGLMRPLKVTRSDGKLIVIDGHKRLIALRRLKFKNKLPRSLVNIPYVLEMQEAAHLMSDQERYSEMNELSKAGLSASQIAAQLCTDIADIHALEVIDRLSPRLIKAFKNRVITLAQAHAFGSIGWHEAQDSLLLNVGPSASVAEILSKVDAVLDNSKNSETKSNVNSNVIHMAVPPLKGVSPSVLTDALSFAA